MLGKAFPVNAFYNDNIANKKENKHKRLGLSNSSSPDTVNGRIA